MSETKRIYSQEYNRLTQVLNQFFWTPQKESIEDTDTAELPEILQNAQDARETYGDSSETFTLKELFAKFGVMLCGGTINSIFSSRKVNDLDFYVQNNSNNQIGDLIKIMKEVYNYKVVHTSDNAITLTRRGHKGNLFEIQFITRFTGSPQDILDTFDYTIVQGVFDFKTNQFVLSDRFLVDIAKRQLVYTNTSEYPICALYRTKKYIERGYTISGANLVAISLSIHALKLETYADLKNQLMGIDTSMLKELETRMDASDANIDTKTFELSEFLRDWMDLMMTFHDDGL